jgi:hypothetical protein
MGKMNNIDEHVDKLITEDAELDGKEITDIIYDTLMKNVGPVYTQLDLDMVDDQEVDARKGTIRFKYGDKNVVISVSVSDV